MRSGPVPCDIWGKLPCDCPAEVQAYPVPRDSLVEATGVERCERCGRTLGNGEQAVLTPFGTHYDPLACRRSSRRAARHKRHVAGESPSLSGHGDSSSRSCTFRRPGPYRTGRSGI